MFGKFLKPQTHYVFDYKPRYYSERKERLQKLEEKYHGKSKDVKAPRIKLSKNNLRQEWTKTKRTASDRATTLRLAVIITLLFGIAAYILDIHTLF
ncbi:MAG TPA: hypothetical protein VJ970_06395 [Flavobacteriaceae bacterium]|nr:hypothetical protein [Flavobacteriaceae bacterium]